LVDGNVVRNSSNPFYPYDITEPFNMGTFANGVHNITAVATDKVGHATTTSILINVSNQSAGFEWWLFAVMGGAGVLALAVVIHFVRVKKHQVGKKQ
jgi:hypothetical protein